MENNYNEERFDSFINKTIIYSSKNYFKKQMNIVNKEKRVSNYEDFEAYLKSNIGNDSMPTIIDHIADNLELNNALKKLSGIEQSVIFLLFNEDLSQEDAANILEICSKSVSRIKIRALNKMKEYFNKEKENKNEQ